MSQWKLAHSAGLADGYGHKIVEREEKSDMSD